MANKTYLVLFLVLITYNAQAQLRGNNWLFGDTSFNDTSIQTTRVFDFSVTPLSIWGFPLTEKKIKFYEANSSISTPSGELLWYSNGIGRISKLRLGRFFVRCIFYIMHKTFPFVIQSANS